MVSIMPQVKAGKLRPLGVSAASRLKSLPEVATIAETSIPGFEAGTWYGVAAPANTPPDIVSKLSREITRIVALPDVQARLLELGLVPFTNTPAEYAALIKADTERFAKVIKAAGIKLD